MMCINEQSSHARKSYIFFQISDRHVKIIHPAGILTSHNWKNLYFPIRYLIKMTVQSSSREILKCIRISVIHFFLFLIGFLQP